MRNPIESPMLFFNYIQNTLEDIIHWNYAKGLIYKYAFLVIFRYFQIEYAVKNIGVDQVLTQILQIDQKLTFNIFHILNQYRISKIEKNIW